MTDSPTSSAPSAEGLQRRIFRLWLPLAASWLMMGAEMPLYSAVAARLPEAKASLAAFSSLVFPVALIVEGPIIMLLAASTALSRDLASYKKLRRFAHLSGAALSGVHALIAFTPLFDLLAREVLDVPEEVIEPARQGLRILTPWTWAIATRRFQQGVLIRFERSKLVGVGTAVRLLANALVCGIGLAYGTASGAVVGCAGIAAGVLAEAVFAGLCVRPLIRGELAQAEPVEPLTRAAFARFYGPLALTPLITLAVQPVSAGAMARMPRDYDSLASWTPVWGLIFLTRSVGFAYNEVVVRLLDEPGGARALARFGRTVSAVTFSILVLLAATPLAGLWFEVVSGLDPEMAAFCRWGVALGVLMPVFSALQSWFNGILVHAKRTRAITESVSLYMLVVASILAVGVATQPVAGMYYTIGALTAGGLAQTLWVGWRARPHLRMVQEQSGPAPRPLEA